MTPKTSIQKQISKLTYNTYFDSIPLAEIFEIVKSNGGLVVDESGMPWGGILCGANSRATFDIQGIKGQLVLSWYKMQSGRYEVTAYIS